jgi:AraC-like DNA-binding protein
VLVDLVSALFAQTLDVFAPEAHRRTLVLRIREFITRHLHDPDLAPGTIAAAHHISTSYLHRLFQSDGVPVSSWIRSQRLERARRDLVSSTVPVHDIAARWGFTHHAAFTRVFRAAYGVAPRDYRLSSA